MEPQLCRARMSALDEPHAILLLEPSGRPPEPDGSVVAEHDDRSEARRTALLQGRFGAIQQQTRSPRRL